jgi:hypothetical protein
MDHHRVPYTPRTSADPANSPRTNPLRSNNERDTDNNYDPELNESTSDISSSQQSMEDRSTEERDAQTLSQILSVGTNE